MDIEARLRALELRYRQALNTGITAKAHYLHFLMSQTPLPPLLLGRDNSGRYWSTGNEKLPPGWARSRISSQVLLVNCRQRDASVSMSACMRSL
jgi:hypothetical protein